MPTLESIDQWIEENLLEADVWVSFENKPVAFIQTVRHLTSWFPDAELTVPVVAYQAIWEIKGLDPVLKYSGQGVRSLTDNQERVDYGDYVRHKVAPEVLDLLGPPIDKKTEASIVPQLFGGRLI